MIKTFLVWLLLATPVYATTYYIGPSGSNANNGISSGTPWKTFGFAIPLLNAGDTLYLLDGTYTNAVTGLVDINCTTTAHHGTAGNVITFRSLNERKAFLKGEGSGNPFSMYGCNYWTIHGIRAEEGDFSSEPGDYAGTPLVVRDSTHITIQRTLLRFPNRYKGGTGLYFRGSNSLIEENELYSYARHGFQIGSLAGGTNSTGNVYRRNYANSRAYADIVGGYPSANGETGKGDSGFIIYGDGGATNNVFENNISEGNGGGFYLNGYYDIVSGTAFYGNVSLTDSQGIFGNGGPNANGIMLNTVFQDHVVVSSTSFGWQLGSTKNTTCRNCTVVAGGNDELIYYNSNVPSDGVYSFTGQNILIVDGAAGGFNIEDSTHTWTADYINVFNSVTNYTPSSSGHYTHKSETDPVLGVCTVYIPLASPMHAAGLAGADIGANIIYRYVNGILTADRLWDVTTGAFPCGAQIAGVNDTPGSSCYDVHERLEVNTAGCPFPTGSPSAPMVPYRAASFN